MNKKDHWLWQYITHPVLGWIAIANLASIVGVLAAFSAGVNSNSRWMAIPAFTGPLSICWGCIMALTRPAPKWKDGRWIR